MRWIEYLKKVKSGKIVRNFAIVIVGIVALFAFAGPLVWMVMTAFKKSAVAAAWPPVFVFTPTLENFGQVLAIDAFRDSLYRSLIVASGTTALCSVLGYTIAYGFSRYSFRNSDNLFMFILSMRMLPPIAVALPFFLAWTQLGLYDTSIGLILVYTMINIPIAVWFGRTQFDLIPKKVEESARVYGCSQLKAFYKITLPAAGAGLLVIGGLIFILAWNELLIASTLTNLNDTLPMVVAANARLGMTIPWGQVAAMTILLILPPLLVAGSLLGFLRSIATKVKLF